MLGIPGYHVHAQIHETAHSQIFRGQRAHDGLPVIFKLLRSAHPTPEQITRYKREYATTQALAADGVIGVYELQQYQHTYVMILEDFGGTSLVELAAQRQFACLEVIELALLIVGALGRVHASGVIHRDVNPSNIVYNPATGQLKLIDFGIATAIPREPSPPNDLGALEGTLAYLSPEQTGRMNRSVDYRTDFYALGVTLYQLLTGRLPFDVRDPLELLHHHLAVQPAPPHTLDPAIPPMVSALVLKLMAKTAEERYQSVHGLRADLERCRAQLAHAGRVEAFALAEHDISDQFTIPERLYGRERECAQLMALFAQVVDRAAPLPGAAFVLVAGYAGVGKSALVHELHRPITRERGRFIAGKFDQYQHNIPYFAVVQAFQALIRQLLGESEARLDEWRAALRAALGSDAQVIVQVIPALALLIGPQPGVPELPPAEAQRRFDQLFLKFCQVFARPGSPLVLFLDDLQWADNASLKLVELLATEASGQALLLIGAYRDNEVHAAHPLAQAVEAIERAGGQVMRLALAPLHEANLAQLVADTLHRSPAEVQALAALLYQKTDGNPFFARAFLQALHAEGQIVFRDGGWAWSIEQIGAHAVTENVVDLMTTRIAGLDEPTQRVLGLAACIGNQFDLATLAAAAGAWPRETAQVLHPAIVSGLIVPLSASYVAAELGVPLPPEAPPIVYQFAHDRVQQAAYAQLAPGERRRQHWRIGQCLLQLIPAAQVEQRAFDIANQLNQGRPEALPQEAADLIVTLNLQAAQQARAAAAFASAFQYAQAALADLPERCWDTQYGRALELHTLAVELAYLNGDLARMEQLSHVVLGSARATLDTIGVHEVLAQSLLAQGEQVRGIEHLLAVLAQLGVQFPAQPTGADVAQAMAETQSLLAGRPVATLIELPPMRDARILAVMRLLASILSAAHTANPNLFPLVVLRQVALSIQYGNAATSSFAYALYGLILCGVVLQIGHGAEFCSLALRLLARQGRAPLRARTLLTVHAGAQYWTEHLRATLRPLQECYQAAVEDGDPEFAGYTALHRCDHAFFAGLPLAEVAEMLDLYHRDLSRLRQRRNADALVMFQQAVHALSTPTTRLQGATAELPADERALVAANDRQRLFLLYLNRLILSVILRRPDEALAAADAAGPYLDGVVGQASVAVYRLYDSLARLGACAAAGPTERAALLRQVEENQGLMELWARHAPMNYLHRWQLVAAELHRVSGQPLEAMAAYDRAIALAQEHGYLHEEALANELAAQLYLERGLLTSARAYLGEARYAYLRWGAAAKVNDLDQRYPTFQLRKADETALRIDTTAGGSRLLVGLDLATVLKASQAIASEIELDALLDRLMTILIEHVGAEAGYLALPDGETWRLAAVHAVGTAAPAGVDPALPLSIVNYAARTRETVVLGHAARAGEFTDDPWIVRRQSKAVLAAPLVHQGRLVGVVVLENNLASDLFTPARTEILNLLAAQAASSISHARLLRDQTDLNRALQAEVDAHARSRRDRDRLAAILEASPDYVAMSDASGKLFWNNAPLRRLAGQIPDADAQIAHYHPAWAWEILRREGIPTAMRAGSWVGETAICAGEGREIPVSQLIIAHRDPDGQLAYLSTIMRDISALKAAEAEIRQLNAGLEARVVQRTAQLEAANHELEAFSYSVSHDLRAPLRAIDGFSRLLHEDYGEQLAAEGQRYLTVVRQNVRRMGDLIDDLLSFSRMSRQELHLQPVAPAAIVQSVLRDLAPELVGRAINWSIGELPPCQGDPSLLQQVWVNLLSNAVKYTSKRSPAQIAVGYEQVDGVGAYFVRDNGAGFDMRYADKLFGVFQRLHRPQDFEGTGIGLAIVQRIVQRHGGRIWADAAVDQGATFFFTLPEHPTNA